MQYMSRQAQPTRPKNRVMMDSDNLCRDRQSVAHMQSVSFRLIPVKGCNTPAFNISSNKPCQTATPASRRNDDLVQHCASVPHDQLTRTTMGNICSGGLCDTDTNHHVGMYKDYSKYTAPPPIVNNSIEQKRSSHSSSPDRRRQGPQDGQVALSDEPEGQHEEQQWRSPAVVQEQLSAAPAGQEVAEEQPPEPFSWTKGELIGIGAFGHVFSALNNSTGELVAVKQVSFAKDEALQGRVSEHVKALRAEVEMLKKIKHENIVRYLGTESAEDSLFIFLEYVPGGSIASLLAKFGAFPEKVIRVYTAQLLRGLEYLHQKNIMHRDIKGANILVDKQGTVKLADFGASKKILADSGATVGSAKSIRGTPYWMAPEVIKQTGSTDGRPADIWSLACTVIEMATGKPPWNNYTTPVAAMFQIASSKDPPPLPEHLSREAKDFLLLCFNRVARDRANATRLLKHPFVAGVLDQPRQPPAPTTPPSNAISSSNSSPGQPVSGGNTPSRLTAATSAPQGCCAAQHNGRQSAGVMAAGMNAHRPPTVGAMSAAQAAMKASRQSRSSPTQARSSPMRQQQHPADGSKAGGPLPAHGDAAAVVTAARSPLQPQPQQPKQQQEQLQKAQQQQHSPKPFDAYQHQQPQPQQQQQQQPQQPAEASNRASPAAPSAEASSASDVGQDACMTLVDWNPVTEPSWLPPYQPQPSGSKCQQAAAAVTSSQQQQPQQVSDKQQDGNHKGPNNRPAAVFEPPDADAHKSAGNGRGPGLSNSIGAPAAQPPKRGSMLTNSSSNSSASKRGVGNNGAGPLSQGPAGRASSIINALNMGMGTPAGGSILAGAGVVKSKHKQAGSILQQAGLAGSLVTAASGSSASLPPPTAAAPAEDQAASHDQRGNWATAAPAASQADDINISSKRVQWENELYEELEKHRKEQRVARQANQAARMSAMQQQKL